MALTDNASSHNAAGYRAVWQQPGVIYVLALALVAVSVLLRTLIAPTLAGQSLLIFLMPAVLISGIVGGLGPGLLATSLSLALHFYVTSEVSILTNLSSPYFRVELARAATFALLGIGIAWFGERLRSMRAHADESARSVLAREAHVRSILDTVPDAMVVIDERGIMNSFSAAAERLFGYRPDEVLGKNVKMLMPSP